MRFKIDAAKRRKAAADRLGEIGSRCGVLLDGGADDRT